MLASFLFDGIIDELLFKSMISRAKAAGARCVFLVEMVSVIWPSR
jgi:hypothetical protein